MLSTFTRPNRLVTGFLAAIILVVLAAGILGAATTSTGESPAEKRQKEEAADRRRQEEERKRQAEANKDAAQLAEADKRAFDLILANQEACKNKYLPEADARAKSALDQLKEQEAALTRVMAELPPGKAKDTLASQIRPDFDSSADLINAELRAATTRCQLAFTVYQYTHDTVPKEGS
jgi:hypothetical protein